jgi:hypothetical protein
LDQEFDERDIEEFSTAHPFWLKQKIVIAFNKVIGPLLNRQ